MNEAVFLGKTEADFIIQSFCFRDGVAYFYGKLRDGVIEYYVHDGEKDSGPFKTCPHINVLDPMYIDKKELLKKSIKDFKWDAGQKASYLDFCSNSFMDDDFEDDTDDDVENIEDVDDDENPTPADHPITQDEIGQLLDSIAQGKPEWKEPDAEDSNDAHDSAPNPNEAPPQDEYDEQTHILKCYKEDGDYDSYFVTPSKKYGPLNIYNGAYKDQNNFQFVYSKGDNFGPNRIFYYNYNGREIEVGKRWPRIFYDIDGHAICDSIDKNYLYIDGVKTDYFNGSGTEYNYNKDENHSLIAATATYDKNTVFYLLDGKEHYINPKGEYQIYKAEAIIYRTTNYGLETHYYNEISVPVPASYNEFELSYIFGSAIRYWQHGIPQLLLKGQAYNALPAYHPNGRKGFIYLSNGALYFQDHDSPEDSADLENKKRLFDNHLRAGE